MTDIFVRPGVVDALDKYGRPMEVPIPNHVWTDAPVLLGDEAGMPLGIPMEEPDEPIERERKPVPHGFGIVAVAACTLGATAIGWIAGRLL